MTKHLRTTSKSDAQARVEAYEHDLITLNEMHAAGLIDTSEASAWTDMSLDYYLRDDVEPTRVLLRPSHGDNESRTT